MNNTEINTLFTEQTRQRSLVTPETFSVALGTSTTTVYPGRENEYFLIRKLVGTNTTGGSIDLTLTVGGITYTSSKAISGGSVDESTLLAGHLLAPGDTITGSGSVVGLHIFGWGIRVSGGDGWQL